MSAREFRAWQARRKLSLIGTAEALGLGRRMVACDESGARPIPKTVWPATRHRGPSADGLRVIGRRGKILVVHRGRLMGDRVITLLLFVARS